jgi:VanZ family protein
MPTPPAINVQHADKLIHFLAFAGLASLCTAAFSRQRFGIRDISIVLFCLAYAGFDELSQVPVGRIADVFDWVADFAGTLFGVVSSRAVIGRILTHPISRPTRQPTPQEVQQA